MKLKQQQGFTLIELVVVIIILGILAVTAAPKFLNFQGDARAAVLEGVKASLQSANSVVYAKAILAGEQDETVGYKSDNASEYPTVKLEGTQTAEISFGYLRATDANMRNVLDASFDTTDGSTTTKGDFVIGDVSGSGSSITIRPSDAPGTTCTLTYTAAASKRAKPTYAIVDADQC